MWQRSLLALTALLLAGNGAHMLFAPAHWYGSIASVAHTGQVEFRRRRLGTFPLHPEPDWLHDSVAEPHPPATIQEQKRQLSN